MLNTISSFYHLKNFVSRPIPFMHQQWHMKGDFFPISLGPKKFYFVYHPDLAGHILCHRFERYRKSRQVFNRIEPITGKKGLVQLDDEAWKAMRKLTNELFYKQSLDSFIPTIHHYTSWIAKVLAENSQTNTPIEVSSLFIAYTLKTIIKIVTGIEKDDAVKKIADTFIQLNDICGTSLRSAIALPLWFPTTQNLLIKQLQKNLRQHIDELLNNLPSEDLSAPPPKKNCNHLLGILLSSKSSINLIEHRQLIVDQITTFLFAGFETTAASLSFTFQLLNLHSDIQLRIKQEAEQFLPKERLPSVDEIRKLEFTMAVYRESLRLYPPAWILARELREPDTLGGHQLKKGDNLIISVRSIHRHPAIWKQPHRFLPERFYKEHGRPSQMNKFAFIPFGAGARICSGIQLATLESVYVIAKLMTQFQLSPVTRSPLKTTAMITLHPKQAILLNVHGR